MGNEIVLKHHFHLCIIPSISNLKQLIHIRTKCTHLLYIIHQIINFYYLHEQYKYCNIFIPFVGLSKIYEIQYLLDKKDLHYQSRKGKQSSISLFFITRYWFKVLHQPLLYLRANWK